MMLPIKKQDTGFNAISCFFEFNELSSRLLNFVLQQFQ